MTMRLHNLIFAISIICAAGASFAAFDADDARRMALENSADTDAAEVELLNIAQNSDSPNARNGAVYSLGHIKSEKAFSAICAMARDKSGAYPAAFFALAEYGTPDAMAILREFAPKNPAAASALEIALAREKVKAPLLDFAAADIDGKVSVLRLLEPSVENRKFAIALKADSQRLARAQAFALSRLGGADCAEKIFEILREYRGDTEVILALSRTNGADAAIISEILSGNPDAERAAALRKISEAEEPLAKRLRVSENPDEKRECLSALQVVGGQKTFALVLDEAAKASEADLPAYVKVCIFAIGRSDAAAAKDMRSLCAQKASSAQGRLRAAFERIARAE